MRLNARGPLNQNFGGVFRKRINRARWVAFDSPLPFGNLEQITVNPYRVHGAFAYRVTISGSLFPPKAEFHRSSLILRPARAETLANYLVPTLIRYFLLLS
jgi:hypothetical protein